jgi:hypothetical protein
VEARTTNEECRWKDSEIAIWLGYEPRQLRSVVGRNRREFDNYAPVNIAPDGTESKCYWLNFEQICLVCMLSRTKTPRVRQILDRMNSEIHAVFEGKRDHAPGGIAIRHELEAGLGGLFGLPNPSNKKTVQGTNWSAR